MNGDNRVRPEAVLCSGEYDFEKSGRISVSRGRRVWPDCRLVDSAVGPVHQQTHRRSRADDLSATLKPDLILLDVRLPVMDGYAMARSLRENPGLADTPIVAVTSYAMPGDREKTIAAGCGGYIEKPIDPETFVSKVERHLPGRRKEESR